MKSTLYKRDQELVKSIVSKLVNKILKDWLPFKSTHIDITFFESSKAGGSMAYVSNGVQKIEDGIRRPDYTKLELSLNAKHFLGTTSISTLYRTICHETYHLIQRQIYSKEEHKRLGGLGCDANANITSYQHNMLELEAEVFTINLCDASNHSYKNAKQSPAYRIVLDKIIKNSTIA